MRYFPYNLHILFCNYSFLLAFCMERLLKKKADLFWFCELTDWLSHKTVSVTSLLLFKSLPETSQPKY